MAGVKVPPGAKGGLIIGVPMGRDGSKHYVRVPMGANSGDIFEMDVPPGPRYYATKDRPAIGRLLKKAKTPTSLRRPGTPGDPKGGTPRRSNPMKATFSPSNRLGLKSEKKR